MDRIFEPILMNGLNYPTLPSTYGEDLSYLEVVSKLMKTVNDLIEQCNLNTKEKEEIYQKLKDIIFSEFKFFTNDLNEVCKKAQDLIDKLDNYKLDNEDILNLKNMYDTKANYIDFYKNKNISICVGYPYHGQVALHATFDGKNIATIKSLPLPATHWDYGITFLDGWFYLTYDYKVEDDDFNSIKGSVGFTGGNRIGIQRTKDFKDFEEWEIEIPKRYKQIYSPKFFIDDDGTRYLAVVMSDCTEITTDYLGHTQYKMYPYLIKFIDNYKTINTITSLSLPDIKEDGNIENGYYCKIDEFIYKHGSQYYLFIKQENNDYIQEYKSANLVDFELIHEFKGNYPQTEAPCIIETNGKFLMSCFAHIERENYYFESDDLENWSEAKNHNFYGSSKNIMNGSFYTCKEEEEKSIIYRIIKKSNNNLFTDDYEKLIADKTKIEYEVKLATHYDTLKLNPNTVYYYEGKDPITINKLDTSNLKRGDIAYFQLRSGWSSAKIIIKQQNNFYYNNCEFNDCIIDRESSNTLIPITKLKKNYCFVSGIKHNYSKSTTLRDDNTGLEFKFLKTKNIVELTVSSKYSTAISPNRVYVTSFKAPDDMLPINESFNTYLVSNGDFNSLKIFTSGRIELCTSKQNIIANESYFECSLTYITN